jgi:cell division septation protein DedD
MEKNLENKELQLGHRHLLLFFLGAVVICASFFALGFVVGRGQAREATLATSGQPPDDSLGLVAAGTVEQPAGTRPKTVPRGDQPASAKSIQPAATSSRDYRKELDFYSAVKDPSLDENFRPHPSESKKKVARQQPKAQKRSARSLPKTRGLLHLQVAAVKNRIEADRLAEKLRVKGYPVFVVSPSKSESPQWIRVQVGPFESAKKTSQVKAQLARDGYEPLLRR